MSNKWTLSMQNDILKHMVYSNQQIICHAIVKYF